MQEELQKVIEQVRANSKCKKIWIMGTDTAVLKKIDNMKLKDVSIYPVGLLTNKYNGILDNDKLYILPNYQEEIIPFEDYKFSN